MASEPSPTSEPFEATDDNGITVRGTVDVHRDRKGPYFDPNSEYYKHPRYADAHFDYFDTREACTMDRAVLSKAMEDAFAKALTRFTIKNPGPAAIAKQVDDSISATRQQCIRNIDKYISNETFSSTNWETGESVGDVTAKAYAASPAPDGGIRTVVARENRWPADDVAAFKNDGTSDARILSRRVPLSKPASHSSSTNPSLARCVTPLRSTALRKKRKFRCSAPPPIASTTA